MTWDPAWDRDERNELHAAERDEARTARFILTELGRAACCEWPQRPCSCGTHNQRSSSEGC